MTNSRSGWSETYTDADGKTKTRPVPKGWRKEWAFENVYAWVWYGPPYQQWINLCVLAYEPDAKERAVIEAKFADAIEPRPWDQVVLNV